MKFGSHLRTFHVKYGSYVRARLSSIYKYCTSFTELISILITSIDRTIPCASKSGEMKISTLSSFLALPLSILASPTRSNTSLTTPLDFNTTFSVPLDFNTTFTSPVGSNITLYQRMKMVPNCGGNKKCHKSPSGDVIAYLLEAVANRVMSNPQYRANDLYPWKYSVVCYRADRKLVYCGSWEYPKRRKFSKRPPDAVVYPVMGSLSQTGERLHELLYFGCGICGEVPARLPVYGWATFKVDVKRDGKHCLKHVPVGEAAVCKPGAPGEWVVNYGGY